MSATCTTMSYNRSGFVCSTEAICALLSIWNVPIVSPCAIRSYVFSSSGGSLYISGRVPVRTSIMSKARLTSDSAPSPRKSNFGMPTASRSSLSNWMIVRPMVVCSTGR